MLEELRLLEQGERDKEIAKLSKETEELTKINDGGRGGRYFPTKSTDLNKLLPFNGDRKAQEEHNESENTKNRFRERKRNYYEKCNAYNLNKNINITNDRSLIQKWQMPYHFLVSKTYDFGACLPMKTGSSSMFHFIWELDHPADDERQPLIDGIGPDQPNYGGKFYHLVAKTQKFDNTKELRDKLFQEEANFTTIVTVRHPFSRFFSSWNDHMAIRNGNLIGEQHKLFKLTESDYEKESEMITAFRHSLSWPNFVQKILQASENNTYPIDGHHLPIADLCKFCLFKYDFIVKVETMAEDIKYINDNLLNSNNELRKLYSFAKNKKDPYYSLSYFCIFDDEVIRRLERFFDNDFNFFDYERFNRDKYCELE